MFVLFVVLAGVSFAVLVTGGLLALRARGQVSKRTGPGIYGEMMEERMHRDAVRDGAIPLATGVVATGKGVAVEATASYTVPEIRRAVREKRWGAALPALLIMAGLVLGIAFTGLAIAVRVTGDFRYAGWMLVGMAAYGVYLVASDWRKA